MLKEQFLQYLRSLQDQDKPVLSAGIRQYSPADLVAEVEKGTQFGNKLVEYYRRVMARKSETP